MKTKKIIRSILCLCLGLILLGAAGVLGINAWVRGSVTDRILTAEEAALLEDVDCILVLGCAVKENGVPSAMLEDRLKRTLQQAISRGKVEVSLTLQTVESRGGAVAVDHALAGQYLTALRALAAEYDLTDDLTLSTVARLPDLFTVCRGEEDEEELLHD